MAGWVRSLEPAPGRVVALLELAGAPDVVRVVAGGEDEPGSDSTRSAVRSSSVVAHSAMSPAPMSVATRPSGGGEPASGPAVSPGARPGAVVAAANRPPNRWPSEEAARHEAGDAQDDEGRRRSSGSSSELSAATRVESPRRWGPAPSGRVRHRTAGPSGPPLRYPRRQGGRAGCPPSTRSSPPSPSGPGGGSRPTPIAGGLTNTNFRVVVDGVPYFVRIPGPATDLLAVDRANELAQHARRGARPASARASSSTCRLGRDGPRVAARPDDVERRRSPSRGCPSGSPSSLRRLHAGPRFRARLRHVPADRALPRRRRRASARRSRPAIASTCRPSPRIEAALAARPLATRALPQRPAGRELPRRRPTTLDRRLRVQRQQRPDLRARQHLPGARLRRRPDRGAVRRLLRRGGPGAARPDAAPDDHVRRRLDAVGGHPGPDLVDRLRLLGLGRGALGARPRRRSTDRTSSAGWRTPLGARRTRSGASAAHPCPAGSTRTSAATTAGTRSSKTSTSRSGALGDVRPAGRPCRPCAPTV